LRKKASSAVTMLIGVKLWENALAVSLQKSGNLREIAENCVRRFSQMSGKLRKIAGKCVRYFLQMSGKLREKAENCDFSYYK